jgi:hypothetical protein
MVVQVAQELAVLAQPLLEPGVPLGVEVKALFGRRLVCLAHASMVPTPLSGGFPPRAGG